jgi:GT2 family glycosyltransferase
MLRREALNEVGLFDEDYFLYVEDADLCYRMKRHGWKVYLTPDARCTHLSGERIREDNIRPQIYHVKGMYRFLTKYGFYRGLAKAFLTIGSQMKIAQIISWGFAGRDLFR